MPSEGYVKFNCEWIKAEPMSSKELVDLNKWRDKLYKLGLIGAYSTGIGFGNISIRVPESNSFIITGTATGNLSKLDNEHYTKVVKFDVEKNSLTCAGPIKASSESLSHAIIYKVDASVGAVIHIHNKEFWQRILDVIPTTSRDIEYGTPEMAKEIERLFGETDVKERKILAMGGHEEGIISFGKDLEEAGTVLLNTMKIKG
jgi:ribulose-5-phosphate 4-epimerase/fuculose-1-phosphate aldolase